MTDTGTDTRVEIAIERLHSEIQQLREQLVAAQQIRASHVDAKFSMLVDAESRAQKDRAVLRHDAADLRRDVESLASALRDEAESRKAADLELANSLDAQVTDLRNELDTRVTTEAAVAQDRAERQRKITWALGVLVALATLANLTVTLLGG